MSISSKEKIVPLEALVDRRGILCMGHFDLVHVGHCRYLNWAKRQRPEMPLIVGITADAYFNKKKGDGFAFPQDVRAEWLSYLEMVDIVTIVNEPTGVLAINTIKPDFYIKGIEVEGLIPEEESAVNRWGGKVYYFEGAVKDGIQVYSSGAILDGQFSRRRASKDSGDDAGSKGSVRPVQKASKPRGVGEGDVGVE